MIRAHAAFVRLLRAYEFTTVLDVGCGAGFHALAFAQAGKTVITTDLRHPADIRGDFLDVEIPIGLDAVWVSHVLEHQRNVGAFLDKVHRILRPGGVLAVTVPPEKPEIVGGHLTVWNAGLLLYNLILAGFDCRHAEVLSVRQNISVIVRRGAEALELPELRMDAGDIETLAPYFPLPVHQGFDGRIDRLNWPEA